MLAAGKSLHQILHLLGTECTFLRRLFFTFFVLFCCFFYSFLWLTSWYLVWINMLACKYLPKLVLATQVSNTHIRWNIWSLWYKNNVTYMVDWNIVCRLLRHFFWSGLVNPKHLIETKKNTICFILFFIYFVYKH